jgi:hypothetical protein
VPYAINKALERMEDLLVGSVSGAIYEIAAGQFQKTDGRLLIEEMPETSYDNRIFEIRLVSMDPIRETWMDTIVRVKAVVQLKIGYCRGGAGEGPTGKLLNLEKTIADDFIRVQRLLGNPDNYDSDTNTVLFTGQTTNYGSPGDRRVLSVMTVEITSQDNFTS